MYLKASSLVAVVSSAGVETTTSPIGLSTNTVATTVCYVVHATNGLWSTPYIILKCQTGSCERCHIRDQITWWRRPDVPGHNLSCSAPHTVFFAGSPAPCNSSSSVTSRGVRSEVIIFNAKLEWILTITLSALPLAKIGLLNKIAAVPSTETETTTSPIGLSTNTAVTTVCAVVHATHVLWSTKTIILKCQTGSCERCHIRNQRTFWRKPVVPGHNLSCSAPRTISYAVCLAPCNSSSRISSRGVRFEVMVRLRKLEWILTISLCALSRAKVNSWYSHVR